MLFIEIFILFIFLNCIYKHVHIGEVGRSTVGGWSQRGSAHMVNKNHKIFPSTRLEANPSKNYKHKQVPVILNRFSSLLLPFFCTLLATISHCFSRSRHKKYFPSKYRYQILKCFKQKTNSRLSFIGPKLFLMCGFLLFHSVDKNTNPDLAKL